MARMNVDLIFCSGFEAILQAAIAASRTIPIVMLAFNYDPIARGYVKSLAQPGGNVTGVSLRQTELAEKQVELLTQAFPDKARIAMLWDAFSADQLEAAERRAKSLGLQVSSLKLESPPYDFGAAFRTLADGRPHMVLVLSSAFFARSDRRIAELAIQHRLPTMFIFRGYVEVGGLMSYGAEMPPMSPRFSRAPNRPICRSSSPRNSSLLSTSRLPKRSASSCRRRSCCAPTR
jgi:putative tryptophan/tyrosine transport system substrate-binding protein